MCLQIRSFAYLATVALSLLTTTQSRADYIREENGMLTTDLPGVTITPTTPTQGGSEAWSVVIDQSVWAAGGTVPAVLADEPGKVNFLPFVTGDSFRWESDVPSSRSDVFPSGTTEFWFKKTTEGNITVVVSFEDISDAPSGVPDGGSSFAMLAVAVAGCAGLRKRFAR
jgi:hypothetical protein